MTTPDDPDRPRPDVQAHAAEVEADIARTREDLGRTVEALTQKLDVKTQAQHTAHEVKERAGEQLDLAWTQGAAALVHIKDSAIDERGQLKPVIRAFAAIVAGVLVVVIWKRRRQA